LDYPIAASGFRDRRWLMTLAVLAIGCLGLYLVGASGYDLLTDDEMRYAEAGRRMVESGDWIVPEYNGYPRYQKPILFYWLQALSQAMFGTTAWAARLPTAVAGTLLVLLIASLARELWGYLAGVCSGVVLAVMAGVVLLSRMVMTDIVLLLFIQAALGAFYVAQLRHPSERRRWYLAMWTALALGFLTKGPIAYLLPAAFLLPWLVVRGELLAVLREIRPAWGLAIALLVAGPWYVTAHLVTHGQFTHHFFITENVGRFLTNVNPHEAPPFLYFLILIPLTFPWAGLLPQVVRTAMTAPLRGPFREAIPLLLLGQAVLVFVVFTLSRTRVWTYTLPMLPPLALLVGRWIAQKLANPSPADRPLRPASWAFFAVALLLAVGSGFVSADHLPEAVRHADLLFQVRLLAWLLVSLSLLVIVTDYLGRLARSLTVLVVGTVVFYLTATFTVVPTVDELLREPVRQAARQICEQRANVVVTCHVHELGLNFLTGQRCILHWRTHKPEDLADLLEGPGRVFVLIDPGRWHEFEALPLHVWDWNRRFVLAANFPPDPSPYSPGQRASPSLATAQPGSGRSASEQASLEQPGR